MSDSPVRGFPGNANEVGSDDSQISEVTVGEAVEFLESAPKAHLPAPGPNEGFQMAGNPVRQAGSGNPGCPNSLCDHVHVLSLYAPDARFGLMGVGGGRRRPACSRSSQPHPSARVRNPSQQQTKTHGRYATSAAPESCRILALRAAKSSGFPACHRDGKQRDRRASFRPNSPPFRDVQDCIPGQLRSPNCQGCRLTREVFRTLLNGCRSIPPTSNGILRQQESETPWARAHRNGLTPPPQIHGED